MPDKFSRRRVLQALGVGAGAGVLGSGAAAAERPDPGADDPLSRARAAADRIPRQVLPGARGSANPNLQRTERCFYPNDGKEIYGPTNINATTGNQGLSVALSERGTVTVMRWPRPSFYDQIKHYATDRSKPRMGAAPNEGAFLGVRVETTEGTRVEWLREWETAQRYADGLTDTVVTEHRSPELGLTVTVHDVVAPDTDALVREVEVDRDEESPGDAAAPAGRETPTGSESPDVESVTLLAFENVNPVVTKVPRVPATDWCREEQNDDHAHYDPALDAIVHEAAGVDASVGERRSVGFAIGFDSESTGHQVGGDAYEEAATPAGQAGPTRDAYDDASSGALSGNDRYVGQTTGALATEVDPAGGTATLVVAAGETATEASARLDDVRERDAAGIRAAKREWYDALLGDAPLPETDDEAVLALSRRALVSLVQAYDPETGTVVASIATQSPYGEDWPRDGAYFNYLLSALGQHDWVEKHNRFYARVQQGSPDAYPDPAIPPGNWAMNYYADGVPGGPIPYEIDETGYGVWTMWDHYAVTGDERYLRDVYPAIQRAADYLVECKDPETGLQCTAWEDDIPQPKQTIVGAATVWKGLDAAVKAAQALDEDSDAERYAARRDELAAAIDEHLWAADPGAYGPKKAGFVMAEVAWPLGYEPAVGPDPDDPLDHPRIQSHLDASWAGLQTTFAEPEAGNRDIGLYESKGLVPLAKDRRESEPGSLEQVRGGLEWVAHEHATPDTHIMGEAWAAEETEQGDREIISIISQPHVWEQCLFYMAALEAWPPADVQFDSEDSGGVLEALRERNAPGERRGPPADVPGEGNPPSDPGE